MVIEIERMLFGYFRVQVWDENLDSALDREYFCRGMESAKLTAIEIRNLNEAWKDLDIQYRSGDIVMKLEI